MSHENQKLVQVSSSLDPKLGGPTAVIKATHDFLTENFDAKLIVFGISSIQGMKIEVIPTLRNNRYGLPYFKIKKYIAHLYLTTNRI